MLVRIVITLLLDFRTVVVLTLLVALLTVVVMAILRSAAATSVPMVPVFFTRWIISAVALLTMTLTVEAAFPMMMTIVALATWR